MTANRGSNRFWSNVRAVAYKEASVLRHDKALLATIFIQPIIMLFLFGGALSNEPSNVPWLILDQNQTAVSRQFVEEIRATGYFLAPESVSSYEQGQTRLKNGKALAFLVIPPEFRRSFERGAPEIQLFLDGSDPLSAARIGSYIGQTAAAFNPRRESVVTVRGDGPQQPVPLDVRQRFWFNPTLSDSSFFLDILAGMLLTNLCLSAMSLGLVGERENGTYEQMLASPTGPIELVIGKILPYVVLSYGVLTFALVSAGVVFDHWPRGNVFPLYLVTLPFTLASLSIGVLVSTLAKTSAQAVFITVFFIMPSFVLSGSMFPYQLMPHGIRELGGVFPLRWYQIALRRITARGGGLDDIAVPLLALTTIFVVLLFLIRRRIQPRLA